MSKEEKFLGQSTPKLHQEIGSGFVTLPIDEEQFKQFISSLLGKPQTITKLVNGVFEFNRDNIIQLHKLLEQRIHQQNKAVLIQFTSKVIYSDSSSVLINSFDELITYNEIRPVISNAVHLSWEFLVQFQDKEIPEKQQIEVSIISTDNKGMYLEDEIPIFLHRSGGYFEFVIKHTARTWGADIEALLTSHFECLLKKESKPKKFIRKHKSKIGIFVGILFFLSSITGFLLTTSHFNNEVVEQTKAFISQNQGSDLVTLSRKIDYINQVFADSKFAQQNFYIIIFIVTAITLSIVLGSWSESAADIREPSFVLLTKEAEKNKEEQLKKLQTKWYIFMLSLATSIITGVVANYLFYYLHK